MPTLIGQFGSLEEGEAGAGGGEDIWLATGIFALPSVESAKWTEGDRVPTATAAVDPALDWLEGWKKKPTGLPRSLQSKLV
ncbi:hypothetical protein FRC18_001604 [Serendipita sp. 400]|nr:hypothetical protein FRC18_001604 [Serendipita sp. 400]